MSDTDRLAALLHDVSMEAYGLRRWARAPWPTDLYDWVADRLIAAGVGFRAEAVAAERARIRREVEALPKDGSWTGERRAAVLALLDADHD